MRAQPVDRYLSSLGPRHGVYLVIWFAGVRWDDRDERRARCRRMSLEEARAFFAGQATAVRDQGAFIVEAVVLNASLEDGRGR